MLEKTLSSGQQRFVWSKTDNPHDHDKHFATNCYVSTLYGNCKGVRLRRVLSNELIEVILVSFTLSMRAFWKVKLRKVSLHPIFFYAKSLMTVSRSRSPKMSDKRLRIEVQPAHSNGEEKVKRLVNVYLHCIVRNLKRISKTSTFPPWKNFCGRLWTMFPLKCSTAHYHQTTCAVKSHSRALTTFHIVHRVALHRLKRIT